MEALLSPLGIGLALLWSFAVLASVQLTVRLIMAFSVTRTVLGALALTAITVPLSVLYLAALRPVARRRCRWRCC